MQHLDEGTIHAWLDDALASDERARVEEHVGDCAACAALVAEARGMIAGASRVVSALDLVPGGVIPRTPAASPRSGSLWRMLHVTPARAALAASLLIAVATMLTVRHDTPDKVVPRPIVQSQVPSATPAIADSSPSADRGMQTQTIAAASGSAHATHSSRRTQTTASPAPALAPPLAQPAAPAPATAQAALDAGTAGVGRAGTAGNMRLESVVTTGASAAGFAGCYRISRDSGEWLRSIPERFALEASEAKSSSSQQPVRAVAADGRPDTALTGGTWQPLSPTSAVVTFIVPEGRRTLTMQLAAAGTVTARSASTRGFVPVAIERASCAP
jgi:hypothetical protein